MTQKDLVLKWNEQHLTPTQIHEKLKDLFEEKSISLSTVSRTIRQLSWTSTKQEPEKRSGRPPNYKIDMAILECLDSDPYFSCCEIAKIIKIDYSSVRYVLINRLHFKWHH